MMELKRLWMVVGLSAVLLWVAGCGPSGPAVEPVSGTVKFADGSPLTQGKIVFAPVAGGDVVDVSPMGQVKEDGSYTLLTGEFEGAPAGTYKVYFLGAESGGYVAQDDSGEDDETVTDADYSGGELLIHSKYLNPTTTDIEVEVKPGGGDIAITVDKPDGGPPAETE